MFEKARLKLTAFYLLIIMTISVVFSLVVYRVLTLEIARGIRIQALRIERFVPPNFHRQIFEEAKRRIATQLALINLGILVFSGGAGYFLAGRTLKPIAEILEEQKRFVADASHELRTPLTAIETETEVTLRDKKLDLKSAKTQLLSNLEEVDKLRSLTDYFLTLSKYQDTNLTLPFARVGLEETIEKAIEKISTLAREKDITIKKELKDVTIDADETSVVELLTILLDNAIKYSYHGGEVRVRLFQDKRNAIISVQDFGIGIKASDVPYIFNRFYRADSSRSKTTVKGYGLGLSIAKSIVEVHQGKIEVKSLFGKGTTFAVTLPVKKKFI